MENETVVESTTTEERNKENMIYFHLPDYSQHFRMNYLLATLMRDCPEYFHPNIAIGSIYGSFPGAIWNGGRLLLGGCVSREDIIQCYKAFNDIGIPLRHTFTNSLIDNKLVWDAYCNEIMKLGDNGLNQVLVNSPDLERYIRETYPNYPVLSSTTKRIKNLDAVVKEQKEGNYHLVVLDYSLNRNPKIFFLDNPDKYEILINAYCCDDCPNRVKHYKEMARDQIHFGHIASEDGNDIGPCKYVGDDFYTALANRKSILKVDEIYGFYKESGFRHFKIEGRTTNTFDVLESYMYYMVKPEYKDHVRLLMLRRIFEPQQPQQQIMIMTPEQIKELEEKGQVTKLTNNLT